MIYKSEQEEISSWPEEKTFLIKNIIYKTKWHAVAWNAKTVYNESFIYFNGVDHQSIKIGCFYLNFIFKSCDFLN